MSREDLRIKVDRIKTYGAELKLSAMTGVFRKKRLDQIKPNARPYSTLAVLSMANFGNSFFSQVRQGHHNYGKLSPKAIESIYGFNTAVWSTGLVRMIDILHGRKCHNLWSRRPGADYRQTGHLSGWYAQANFWIIMALANGENDVIDLLQPYIDFMEDVYRPPVDEGNANLPAGVFDMWVTKSKADIEIADRQIGLSLSRQDTLPECVIDLMERADPDSIIGKINIKCMEVHDAA